MKPIRTSLSFLSTAKNEDELHEIKRKAWVNGKDLVVMNSQAEHLSNIERIFIEALGQKLYGKPHG